MLKIQVTPALFLTLLFFAAAACAQVPAAPAVAQGETAPKLAELAAGLKKAEQDATAFYMQATAALNKSYTEALDRAIATATKGGKLDEILKLRAEKKSIEGGFRVPPEDDDDTAASLKPLRESYRKADAKNADDREKALKPSYLRYDKTLADYQTALTKQGRIEDAVLVKTARDEAAAKHADASTPKEEEAPVLKGDVKPTMAFAEMKKKGGVLKGVGFFMGDKHIPMDLSAANAYHDFVEVYVGDKGWVARRANGDLIVDSCSFKKWKSFHERGVKSVAIGNEPVYLTRDGELKVIYGEGKKASGDQTSRKFFFPIGLRYCNIAFDRNGMVALWQGGPSKSPAPPKDLFQNAVAFTASNGVVGFFTDRPPVSWDWDMQRKSFTFPAQFKGCIQGAAKLRALIMRNLAGKVFVTSGDKVETDAVYAPPAPLPPAIRVRAGSDFCAAQAADGTWQAWGKPGEALKRIKEFGTALDLDGTESDLNRGCLMWIEPVK